MTKYYMTKGNEAFEFEFNGNSIISIRQVEPITRLGDLNGYEEWDENKKMKARRAFDAMFGL